MAASNANSYMASVNAKMLASGRYSDLTIICQNERFKVHRAVVCLQSKPLAAAVDGMFKEAITGEIDLDDCESGIVKKFIEFLYLGDYSDARSIAAASAPKSSTMGLNPGRTNPQTPVSSLFSSPANPAQNISRQFSFGSSTSPAQNIFGPPITKPTQSGFAHAYSEVRPVSTFPDPNSASLMVDVKLYIMGDRYDIQPLKELAKKKYEKLVTTAWNSNNFVSSLKLLYEQTAESDRALKNVAIKAATDNVKAMVQRSDFIALCKSNGEIATSILVSSFPIAPAAASFCPTPPKICPFCHTLDVHTLLDTGGFRCKECVRCFS